VSMTIYLLLCFCAGVVLGALHIPFFSAAYLGFGALAFMGAYHVK